MLASLGVIGNFAVVVIKMGIVALRQTIETSVARQRGTAPLHSLLLIFKTTWLVPIR